MTRLVLFDVDRTLLSGNSIHEQAFSAAIKAVFGLDTGLHVLNHHGRTDCALIREVLELAGLERSAILARLGDVKERMVAYFEEHLTASEARPLPGVPKLLEALAERAIPCALATGNLEAIARAKLSPHDFERRFPSGGFGDAHEDRADVIRAAIRRSGIAGAQGIFHVGDTPPDLEAAERVGVRGVGVATGIYSRDELAACPHHAVFDDLSDTASVLSCLGV